MQRPGAGTCTRPCVSSAGCSLRSRRRVLRPPIHFTGTLSGAAPDLTLGKSALISALHKLDRRDRPAARKALVHAFFGAVARVVPAPSTERPTPSVPTQLSAAITNVLNRFAVTLFEEGSVLHLTDAARAELVRHLVVAQQRRARCQWGRVIQHLHACIDLTTGVWRGRLISLTRCQVLFQPDDGTVPDRVRTLFQQLESRFKGDSVKAGEKEELLNLVCKRFAVARPLLADCDFYPNCKELARVLWMSAAIASLVTDDVRSAGPERQGRRRRRFRRARSWRRWASSTCTSGD